MYKDISYLAELAEKGRKLCERILLNDPIKYLQEDAEAYIKEFNEGRAE
jgi:hypothetical protein